MSPYLPVAEDLEWLRSDWCSADTPSTGVLRRGSAALRQLLCGHVIQRAWHYHGLSGAPVITGPDLQALAANLDHDLRHAVSVIAGGAHVRGVEYSFVGMWRADSPTTGISADADEGFAVSTGSIARLVQGDPAPDDLTPLVQREWRIDPYLKSPGAVRSGQSISRGSIIQFFANYAGGVHLDRVTGQTNAEKRALYEFVADLEQRVSVDEIEGLYFELLSIGQALGRSPSLGRLAEAIRRNDVGVGSCPNGAVS